MAKTIQFANTGTINPERVKNSVYNRIDFDLPESMWDNIESAFAECWNEKIGLRGIVDEGQIEKYIQKSLIQQNIIFDFSRIETIVNIIFDYISISRGFLNEKL